MKKKLAFLMASMMALSLVGCGSSNSGTTAAASEAKTEATETKDEAEETEAASSDEKYEFSMSMSYDVKSPMAIAAQKFSDDVKEASNGRLVINLFTNSALGSEADSYIAVAGDELEMTCAGVQGLDAYAPRYSFLSAPFLFKNTDHIKAVVNSELGDGMKEDFIKNNLRMHGIGYRTPRVMSSNKPIYTPDDLNGLKMRVSEMSSWVSIWGPDTLGATAITMPLGELYGALQNGTAEASEGPYEQLATNKFYEVQKYVIDTNHVYEWVAIFISEKTYQSLPKDLQDILSTYAVTSFGDYCTELNQETSDAFLQELLDNGMERIEPDQDAFREKALASYDKWFADEWTVTNYEEVMSYAK